MTTTDPIIDLAPVDEAIARIGRTTDKAIPLLQALQTHYRYLPEAALRRVARDDPGVVFINSSTPTIDDDLAFAAALKRRLPGAVTAIFGIHPTVMHADLLRREPLLDYCVVGEPEQIAPELKRRYDDVISRVSFYAPYKSDPERWKRVLADLSS